MTSCSWTRNTLEIPHLQTKAPQEDSAVMVDFQRLVDEQGALCKEHLNALHKQWLGPRGLFASFGAEVERLGRQAPALDDVDRLKCPQRVREAEVAVAFALAQSNRRGAAINPFSGRKREALCCVVFDESGACTLVERFAAYEAIRHGDSDFFIKLIATTRGVVERRIVFRGLLEHYDRLLPLEQSIYPQGYRPAQQAHLDREEGLYGPLMLPDSLVVLLECISPVDLLNHVKGPMDSLL